jgi:hypothetical protein
LSLVEIECLRVVLRQFDDGRALRCGCHYYLGLKFGKALLELLSFVGELLFGFRGQGYRGSQVVVGALRSSPGCLPLLRVLFDQLLGSSHLVLCGDQRFAQTFKLSMQVTFCLARIRGRNERTHPETRIAAERLMKPDRKLPRHLQLVERLASITGVLMCRCIAGFAQSVKQLRHLCVDDLAVPELIDQLALGFVFFNSHTCTGCRVLGQEFTKLAKLEQSCIRIIEDIAFGECYVTYKHIVILYEEGKIR